MYLAFLIKYWKAIAFTAFLLLLLLFWQHDRVAQYNSGYNAATAEINAKIAESTAKMREKATKSSQDYQNQKAAAEQKVRTRYVQIEKIVERPVYRNVCLDDDGVSVINAAIKD